MTLGVIAKMDNVTRLMYLKLSPYERARVLYEYGHFDEMPMRALAQAELRRQQEKHSL